MWELQCEFTVPRLVCGNNNVNSLSLDWYVGITMWIHCPSTGMWELQRELTVPWLVCGNYNMNSLSVGQRGKVLKQCSECRGQGSHQYDEEVVTYRESLCLALQVCVNFLAWSCGTFIVTANNLSVDSNSGGMTAWFTTLYQCLHIEWFTEHYMTIYCLDHAGVQGNEWVDVLPSRASVAGTV